jgi:oxygen-independent coproporphyrinogen III oxidase
MTLKPDPTRQEALHVTPELLAEYDRPGPRYTSYPTVPEWSREFKDSGYRKALTRAAQSPNDSLCMYVHIPFCRRKCAFCGCNSMAVKGGDVVDSYLVTLSKEVGLVAKALGKRRTLRQLHWGGGTPTFLSVEQIRSLFTSITEHFEIHPEAEVALEVDPRVTQHEQLQVLRGLGFNRISMGVQDLTPEVQAEIGRYQTEEQTRQLLAWAREVGFGGVNFDLIYGLPGQKRDTWRETIKKVAEMRPDRLAVYSYAFLPERIKNQSCIDATKLPSTTEKFELFALAREEFTSEGYRVIGMDHFALPEDELAKALDERKLHRNFMGYTVVPAADMVGLGASAIGEVGGCYAQNEKVLAQYEEALDGERFATSSGCTLSEDDEIRRWVIRQIMCNFYLDTEELARHFGVVYSEYFTEEDRALQGFLEEDFLVREGGNLRILPLGQVFIRNIAMVFDAYLRKKGAHLQFSRTV